MNRKTKPESPSGTGRFQEVLLTGLTDLSFFRNKSISESLKKGNFILAEAQIKPLIANRSKVTLRTLMLWSWFVLISLVTLFLSPKKIRAVLRSETCFFGYPSNLCFVEMAIVKHVFRKTVIFDPFIFLSDTIVDDRRYTSLRAAKKFLSIIDKCGVRSASVVLADCSGHAEYLLRNFGVNGETLHVGANDDLFFPDRSFRQNDDNEVLKLYTHSTFIPLHGLHTLVDAMSLIDAKKFHLRVAGFGQEYCEVSRRVEASGLSNVALLGMIPQDSLRAEILASDLCLGIFGSSEKSKRVIPQKFFEFIACAKPVLTQFSLSYTSDLSPAFYSTNNPENLATVLEEIYQSRDVLPERGSALYEAYCSKYGLKARDREVQRIFASHSD